MLTPKQENFCKAIVEGMSQSDAYRSAYNTKRMTSDTIYKRASELMENGEITGRVKELRDKVASTSIMTAQERQEWLSELIRDKEIPLKDRLSASDQLNRMQGEYIQKVQADVKTDRIVNVELVDE